MTILKRNQIIVILLAIMIVAAGYLNMSSNKSGQLFSEEIGENIEEKLGSATLVNEDTNNVSEVASAVPANALVTPKKPNTVEQYFIETRMERENARNQEVALQQKIIEQENASKQLKEKAQIEINTITNKIENEMIVERLLKAKGFKDVLVFMNQDIVNIIVSNNGNITKAQAAQIHELALRQTKAFPQNIRVIVK